MEKGHLFNNILSGKAKTFRQETLNFRTHSIPNELTQAYVQSLVDIKKLNTVFLGGRVYDKVQNNNNSEIYSTRSKWRENVKAVISECKQISLDGIDDDLHNNAPHSAAGRSLLHILISQTYLLDATGRIGAATMQEVLFFSNFSQRNLGIIVKEEDYDRIVDYLSGKTLNFPQCIPAYLNTLISKKNIINGYKSVPQFLEQRNKQQKSTINIQNTNTIPSYYSALMLFYAQAHASKRSHDLEIYHNIIDRKNK